MVSAQKNSGRASVHWWGRDDLYYDDGVLRFSGASLEDLAGEHDTPLFVYSADRIKANIARLSDALRQKDLAFQMFYAIKANRCRGVIDAIRGSQTCGIDACSPGEIELALDSSFKQSEISFTGTSVSNADLDTLARYPDILINCDAISTIRRLAERCPDRPVGIRVNPEIGAGYHDGLAYYGSRTPSKFGIYRDRFEEAIDVAASAGLVVERIHFHCGSGFLNDGLTAFESILSRIEWFLDRCPDVRQLNAGGGLGIPLRETDAPLDIGRWADLTAQLVRPRGLKLHVEPGDYLVKDAGVLILEVNTVEDKGDHTFIGVNGGFSIQNLPAFYRTPIHPVPVIEKPGALEKPVVVAGNINEAIDLFCEEILLPEISEGDLLAFLNAGGYGTSAASNHCMRGHYVEQMLD